MSWIPRHVWRDPLVTAVALSHGLTHHPQLLWRPARHLLVVGHMRSNTTVLSYILGSHPQIVGAAEIHQAYRGPFDLVKLRCRLMRTHRTRRQGDTFLDKLLHNRYGVDDRLLARPDVQVLFLMRGPEQTLRSILAMGQQPDEPAWHADPERVTAYYEGRMAFMEQLAARLVAVGGRERASLLTAEDFLANPEQALAGLTRQLGLHTPLSQDYQVFSFTGRKGAGDNSSSIRTGKLVRQATDYSAIALDDGLVLRAKHAHMRTLAALQQQVGHVV
jgi:hypothetical protein